MKPMTTMTTKSSQSSKRLCRSQEWLFGDSSLTLLKSLSTIDNRQHQKHGNVDDIQQKCLSKSDSFLSTTEKITQQINLQSQKTFDQQQHASSMMNIDMVM